MSLMMSFDAVRFTTRCLGEIWDLLVAESVSKGFLPTLNNSSFLQLTGMGVLSNFGYFLNPFISFFSSGPKEIKVIDKLMFV